MDHHVGGEKYLLPFLFLMFFRKTSREKQARYREIGALHTHHKRLFLSHLRTTMHQNGTVAIRLFETFIIITLI